MTSIESGPCTVQKKLLDYFREKQRSRRGPSAEAMRQVLNHIGTLPDDDALFVRAKKLIDANKASDRERGLFSSKIDELTTAYDLFAENYRSSDQLDGMNIHDYLAPIEFVEKWLSTAEQECRFNRAISKSESA